MSVLTHEASHNAPRDALELRDFSGGISALADGKLYALQHQFALDGRVSSYPASARGYAVANCYLVKEDDAALLIDTGFGKDEPAIRAEVESLIAPGSPLSLFPLRLNEFMSINNVETFAGHFKVDRCYTNNIDAALWFDFGAKEDGRNILELDERGCGGTGRHHRSWQAGPADRCHACADPADRDALALRPRHQDAVQLRPVHPHLARQRERTMDRQRDRQRSTSPGDLRSFMLNTRYWWLEGAPTDKIRRGIDAVFEKWDIETIAPGYGCILRGKKLVTRHYQMLDDFLKACDKSRMVSRYVTRDEER